VKFWGKIAEANRWILVSGHVDAGIGKGWDIRQYDHQFYEVLKENRTHALISETVIVNLSLRIDMVFEFSEVTDHSRLGDENSLVRNLGLH
jgi:hypothetical protein